MPAVPPSLLRGAKQGSLQYDGRSVNRLESLRPLRGTVSTFYRFTAHYAVVLFLRRVLQNIRGIPRNIRRTTRTSCPEEVQRGASVYFRRPLAFMATRVHGLQHPSGRSRSSFPQTEHGFLNWSNADNCAPRTLKPVPPATS
jgi:hypothetical protein